DFLAYPVLQFLAQLLGGFLTGVQGDVNVNALTLDVVRHTDNGRLGHFRVRDHGALHFGGTHAVTGNVEHVIHTAGDPPVAVFIATGSITGEVHALEGVEVGVDKAVVVAVQGARLARPGVEDHQVAFARTVDDIAQVVHQ